MPKRVPPANKLTETEAAYLAGIVDGEGCITASLMKRGYINGCLEVASVNRDFLEDMRKLVGTGNICAKGRRSKRAKICYVWHVQLGALSSLLPQLMPYLRLKKPQAKLMLSLVNYSKLPSVVNPTDDFQLTAIKRFRNLNQRGEAILCN